MSDPGTDLPAEPRQPLQRPLAMVAYGFLVVALHDPIHSYDVFADPIGWVLVLVGLRRIARTVDLPAALVLGYLGVFALVCSAFEWWPASHRALQDASAAAVWSVGLAELLFSALLCHALASMAREARNPNASLWFRGCELVLLVLAAAPVLVFGAGIDQARGVVAVAGLVQIAVPVLCFAYSGKEWAGATPRPPRTEPDTDE